MRRRNTHRVITGAGSGLCQVLLLREVEREDSPNLIDLNINGVVSDGLTCLPCLIPSAPILNVVSQVFFQPLPYLNLYSGSKRCRPIQNARITRLSKNNHFRSFAEFRHPQVTE